MEDRWWRKIGWTSPGMILAALVLVAVVVFVVHPRGLRFVIHFYQGLS
jgi:hypothetical protein